MAVTHLPRIIRYHLGPTSRTSEIFARRDITARKAPFFRSRALREPSIRTSALVLLVLVCHAPLDIIVKARAMLPRLGSAWLDIIVLGVLIIRLNTKLYLAHSRPKARPIRRTVSPGRTTWSIASRHALPVKLDFIVRPSVCRTSQRIFVQLVITAPLAKRSLKSVHLELLVSISVT